MVTRRIDFTRAVGLAVLALLTASVGNAVAAPAATGGNIPALPTVTTTPGEAPAKAPPADAPASNAPASPATPATGTPEAGAPATGTPATGTPATGAPATPATGTPAAGASPVTGAPATGTPNAGTPTAATPAAATTAKPKGDDHLDAWVWGAIAAAILLVAGLGWALVVATGRISRLAPVGHAMGEAGWRLSLRWAEFTDWMRFGSGR